MWKTTNNRKEQSVFEGVDKSVQLSALCVCVYASGVKVGVIIIGYIVDSLA